jgi:hypothetical protein
VTGIDLCFPLCQRLSGWTVLLRIPKEVIGL